MSTVAHPIPLRTRVKVNCGGIVAEGFIAAARFAALTSGREYLVVASVREFASPGAGSWIHESMVKRHPQPAGKVVAQ